MAGLIHPLVGIFNFGNYRRNYYSLYISGLILIYTLFITPEVSARGRMVEPAQRSSLWTRGFDSPVNFDDMGLNCGGPWVQHGVNNGRCGVCGDRYDVIPRANEPSGKFANGIIANTYTTNDSSIMVVIDVQSVYGGYFEFRICPHNNVHMSVPQECLNRHQLRVWDLMSKDPKYKYFPKNLGPQRLRVELPPGMTCTQCVLQWKWHTAKDWGRCVNGSSMLGCGPQEEFYNCADIAIEPSVHYNVHLNTGDRPLPSEGPRPALNFEVGFKPYGSNLRQDINIPISFLPAEVLKSGNVGPVLPKFDFYDPSAPVPSVDPRVVPASETNVNNLNGIQAIDNTPVDSAQAQGGAVVLEFNGNADPSTVAVDPTQASLGVQHAQIDPIQTSVVDQNMPMVNTGTQDQTGFIKFGNMPASDISNIVKVLNDIAREQSMVPIDTGIVLPEANTPVVPPVDGAVPSSVSTNTAILPTGMAPTETIASAVDTTATHGTNSNQQANSIMVETKPQDAGGIAIPNLGIGDLNVKVGLGAQYEQRMPTPDVTTWHSNAPANNLIDPAQAAELAALIASMNIAPSVAPTMELPAPDLRMLTAMLQPELLSRRRRQAGIPQPPPGSGSPPPAPAADPGPQGTINFGNLIGDSFSGQSQTQTSFFGPTDFASGAATGMDMTGEALIEPGNVLAPSAIGRGADVRGMARFDPNAVPQSTVFEPMFMDTKLPGPASMHSMAEAAMRTPQESGVPYFNPLIPRPPRQSASELEAAIAQAPLISSAISDTGKELDPSALVGASYIPELNEGRSNQAETSTAARHSSMVIKDELMGRKFGKTQEYLSPTLGTSLPDGSSITRTDFRSVKVQAGYKPTAEEILSGQAGVYHSTHNVDSTSLEAVGPSPTNSANIVPGILNSIIGGGASAPSDSSLDPADQKTRQDLIRQLGEAMGVIGNKRRSPSIFANNQQAATPMISDSTLSSLLSFTGAGQGMNLFGNAPSRTQSAGNQNAASSGSFNNIANIASSTRNNLGSNQNTASSSSFNIGPNTVGLNQNTASSGFFNAGSNTAGSNFNTASSGSFNNGLNIAGSNQNSASSGSFNIGPNTFGLNQNTASSGPFNPSSNKAGSNQNTASSGFFNPGSNTAVSNQNSASSASFNTGSNIAGSSQKFSSSSSVNTGLNTIGLNQNTASFASLNTGPNAAGSNQNTASSGSFNTGSNQNTASSGSFNTGPNAAGSNQNTGSSGSFNTGSNQNSASSASFNTGSNTPGSNQKVSSSSSFNTGSNRAGSNQNTVLSGSFNNGLNIAGSSGSIGGSIDPSKGLGMEMGMLGNGADMSMINNQVSVQTQPSQSRPSSQPMLRKNRPSSSLSSSSSSSTASSSGTSQSASALSPGDILSASGGSGSDLFGIPGMTVEEMMAILNMGQSSSTAATSSSSAARPSLPASPRKITNKSSSPIRSTMKVATQTKTRSGSVVPDPFGMESDMFGQQSPSSSPAIQQKVNNIGSASSNPTSNVMGTSSGRLNEMGSRSTGKTNLQRTVGTLTKDNTDPLRRLTMGSNSIGPASMLIQGLGGSGFPKGTSSSYKTNNMLPRMTTVLAEVATTGTVAERIDKGSTATGTSNTLAGNTGGQPAGASSKAYDPTSSTGPDSSSTLTVQDIEALMNAQNMGFMRQQPSAGAYDPTSSTGPDSSSTLTVQDIEALMNAQNMGFTGQQPSAGASPKAYDPTSSTGPDSSSTLTVLEIEALMNAQNMGFMGQQPSAGASPKAYDPTSSTGPDSSSTLTVQEIEALMNAQNMGFMGQQPSAGASPKAYDPTSSTGPDSSSTLTVQDIEALMKAQNMGFMGQQPSADPASATLDMGNQMMFGLLGMGQGMMDPAMFDEMFGPTNHLDQAGTTSMKRAHGTVDQQAEAKLNAIANNLSGLDGAGTQTIVDPPVVQNAAASNASTTVMDAPAPVSDKVATVQVVDNLAADAALMNANVNTQIDGAAGEGTISLADLLSGAFGFTNPGAGTDQTIIDAQSVGYETKSTGPAGQLTEIAISPAIEGAVTKTQAHTDFTPLGNVGAGSLFESMMTKGPGQEEIIWDPLMQTWVQATDAPPTVKGHGSVNVVVNQTAANAGTVVDANTGISGATSLADVGMFRAISQEVKIDQTANSGPIVDVNTGLSSATGMSMFGASTTEAPYDKFGIPADPMPGLVSSVKKQQKLNLKPEQKLVQSFTEQASMITQTVDPRPTKPTAAVGSITQSTRPPPTQTTVKLVMTTRGSMETTLDPIVAEERRRLEGILNIQKAELQTLQQQQRDQKRQLMLEKQKIEYEQRQLLLKQQQLEIERSKKIQLQEQMLLEKRRRELTQQKEAMRLHKLRDEQQARQRQEALDRKRQAELMKVREAELAKQREIERQLELERQRQLELQRQREAELAKKQQAETLARAREAEAFARAQEAEAAAVAAAMTTIKAVEQTTTMPVNLSQQQTVHGGQTKADAVPSFTPLGSVGNADANVSPDAATVAAWQAFLRSPQGQGQFGTASNTVQVKPPIQAATAMTDQHMMNSANIAYQQQQMAASTTLPKAQWPAQQQNPNAPAMLAWQQAMLNQIPIMQTLPNQAAAQTVPLFPNMVAMPGMQLIPGTNIMAPAAPGTGGIMGAWSGLLQQQKPQTTPAPTTTTTTTTPAPTTTSPKPKIPIRPDPETRNFVRQMFVKNIGPGMDPLSILVGLTPELLMKSGVNPRIANSGDLSLIVPAVERTLGLSLKSVAVGPNGRVRQRSNTGAQPMTPLGTPPRRTPMDRARERREYMLEQRMMTEMMQVLGLGPDPLEPGDPGYRGPGATGRTRGRARGMGMAGGAGGMAMGGGAGMGMGGGMGGMGGMGGAGMGGTAAGNPFEMTDAQQIAMERRMSQRGGMGRAGAGMGGGMGGAMGGGMAGGGLGGTVW